MYHVISFYKSQRSKLRLNFFLITSVIVLNVITLYAIVTEEILSCIKLSDGLRIKQKFQKSNPQQNLCLDDLDASFCYQFISSGLESIMIWIFNFSQYRKEKMMQTDFVCVFFMYLRYDEFFKVVEGLFAHHDNT